MINRQNSQTSKEKQVCEEDAQFSNPEESGSVVKKALWGEPFEEADMEEEPKIVEQKTTVKRKSMTKTVANAARNGKLEENNK